MKVRTKLFYTLMSNCSTMSERNIFGVLTVSDSCFNKQKEDVSGATLVSLIKNSFPNSSILTQIIPDEKEIIVKALNNWSEKCNVIVTTGGTGFSPRDVTPEATKAVIDREAPGFLIAMISKSLEKTPMAMLTRAICGIKGKTIIINLPGSPKGVSECFTVIQDVLQHAIDLLLDKTNVSHGAHGIAPESKSKVKVNVSERARKSIYPLLEVADAMSLIVEQSVIVSLGSETLPIELSLHRILADDVYSLVDIPPFDASIKDGYAVIAGDGKGTRRIVNASQAGDAPFINVVGPGEAVRISTGAPMPNGADAVVQVEDTRLLKRSIEGAELEVDIGVVPTVGLDIRKQGTDVQIGAKVMDKHERILGAHIGVLSSVGRRSVTVFRQASIGVISSGNELVHHSTKELKPGQIYDSNKLAVINLLKQYNFQANDCGIAKDDPDELKNILEQAFDKHDVVITSGGVSMGEFDLVKQVLIEDFGATIHFGRINMKPGKPTTFSTLTFNNKRKMVFSLPGNPASACVTCILFVVQILNHLERAQSWRFPQIEIWIEDAITNRDHRPEFVRVNINSDLRAVPTGNQISSRLNSLVGCNGLVLVEGNTTLEKCKTKALLISSLI